MESGTEGSSRTVVHRVDARREICRCLLWSTVRSAQVKSSPVPEFHPTTARQRYLFSASHCKIQRASSQLTCRSRDTTHRHKDCIIERPFGLRRDSFMFLGVVVGTKHSEVAIFQFLFHCPIDPRWTN